MYATRLDIENSFTILNHRIANPSKFEGCFLYAPYFYELMLNGCEDEITDDADGNMVSVFDLTEDDKHLFPELLNCEQVQLWTDDNGFVHCEEC